MKKKNVGEIIGYIIAGIFTVGGLGLFITSIVGYYLPEGNAIENDTLWGLGFRGWGYVLLAIGLVIGLIVLLTYAKKADVDAERASKRAARLGE